MVTLREVSLVSLNTAQPADTATALLTRRRRSGDLRIGRSGGEPVREENIHVSHLDAFIEVDFE